MAYHAKLNRVEVPLNGTSDAVAVASSTAAEIVKTEDGLPIDFGGKDIRTLIRISTTISGGDTLTLKGGTGAKGVPDWTFEVDGVKYIWVDSAYYMQVSGTYKGCIILVSGDATSSYKTTVEVVTVA